MEKKWSQNENIFLKMGEFSHDFCQCAQLREIRIQKEQCRTMYILIYGEVWILKMKLECIKDIVQCY